MIVVGGWPGRNVIGLNGKFGVRPADFASLGSPSPFLNDVDPGDETTEFVGIVQTLPASGTVIFEDNGGFSHTGASDGSYTATFTLVTWADGGPVTIHTPDEVVSTSFGVGFALQPSGFASQLAYGAPSVSRVQLFTVSPAGQGSELAYGLPVVSSGSNFAVQTAGFESALSYGNPTVAREALFAVQTSGFGSAAAYGNPTFSVAAFDVQPAGLPSELAYGNPTVAAFSTFAVSVTGFASQLAYGVHVVERVGPFVVETAGLPSQLAYGRPTVFADGVLIAASLRLSASVGVVKLRY